MLEGSRSRPKLRESCGVGGVGKWFRLDRVYVVLLVLGPSLFSKAETRRPAGSETPSGAPARNSANHEQKKLSQILRDP
jgi:hypothetical protein